MDPASLDAATPACRRGVLPSPQHLRRAQPTTAPSVLSMLNSAVG